MRTTHILVNVEEPNLIDGSLIIRDAPPSDRKDRALQPDKYHPPRVLMDHSNASLQRDGQS